MGGSKVSLPYKTQSFGKDFGLLIELSLGDYLSH